MRADSKAEAEVMAVLNQWADSYSRRDMNAMESFLSPDADLVLYGTGADEKRIGPDEFKIQVERDWAQTEEISIAWGWHSVSAAGPVAWVASDAAFNIKVEGQRMEFPVRFTSVLERRDNKWLIAQAHISAPHGEQEEGESVPQ